MRYTVIANNYDPYKCNGRAEVDVRSDAKLKTVVKKCIKQIAEVMNLGTVYCHIEYPNIWGNGGVGYISMEDRNDNKYFLTIYRNDNEITIFN